MDYFSSPLARVNSQPGLKMSLLSAVASASAAPRVVGCSEASPGRCSSDQGKQQALHFRKLLFFRAGIALGSHRRAPEQVYSLETPLYQANPDPGPIPDALGALRYRRQTSKQLNNSTEP